MKIDWQSIPTCMSLDRNVVAAWIFGSAQGEADRPGGDIDIGVLFGRKHDERFLAEHTMSIHCDPEDLEQDISFLGSAL